MLWLRIRDLLWPILGLGNRSPSWGRVRDNFIREHPFCAVCGGSKDLVAHHIQPFHLFPDLELDTENLITLCESKKYGINCHLFVGHLGNFRRHNKNVVSDAIALAAKLKDD